MSTWKEFVEGEEAVDGYAACHQWTTSALKALCLLPIPDEYSPDLRDLVEAELERRQSKFVNDKNWSEFRIPIALAKTQSTGSKEWLSPGMLFWFTMRQTKDGAATGLRVRRLFQVGGRDPFRNSIENALKRLDTRNCVFIEAEEGPIHADRSIAGMSAGLTIATYLHWYGKGFWPRTSVAVTGEFKSDESKVEAVEGVNAKLAAARDRGVEWLVAPGNPTPTDPRGLVQVPFDGENARFENWIRKCEQSLKQRGVILDPHPKRWRDWGEDARQVIDERSANSTKYEVWINAWEQQSDKKERTSFYERFLFDADVDELAMPADLRDKHIRLFVATVGLDQNLALIVAAKLKPHEILWLCTDDQEVAKNLERTKSRLKDLGIVEGLRSEGFSPHDWHNEIVKRKLALGLDGNDVVVDLTGGLKDNGIALAHRLWDSGISLIYVRSAAYGSLNRPFPLKKEIRILNRSDDSPSACE